MKYIDGEMLKKAFLAGAKGLEAKKEWINELNVFPVPDGDVYKRQGVDGMIFIQTGEELMSGAFVRARVTGALEYDLIGEIEDEFTE